MIFAYPSFEEPDVVIDYRPDKPQIVFRHGIEPALLVGCCCLITAFNQFFFPPNNPVADEEEMAAEARTP